MMGKPGPDDVVEEIKIEEKDKNKFIEAMRKEVRDQSANRNFSVVRKDKIPHGKNIMKAVWQIRRKRDIRTRKIKKYKATL